LRDLTQPETFPNGLYPDLHGLSSDWLTGKDLLHPARGQGHGAADQTLAEGEVGNEQRYREANPGEQASAGIIKPDAQLF
jgi:hypothetical protein